ncbi:hypothetical protein CUMW_251610, partial [Citrus unshiu]
MSFINAIHHLLSILKTLF